MVFKNEEKFKDDIGIYRIVNTVTGRSYIGQTAERFQRRYWHHNWCLSQGKHHNKQLQKDWRLYGGESFIFEVLQRVSDKDDLDALEIKYISSYRSSDANFGYNLQPGGHSGFNNAPFVSPEARKRVGEANRKRMLGSKLSEETRAKMRASSKHRSPTEEERQALSKRMSERVVSDTTKEKLRQANTGSNSPVAKFSESDIVDIKKRLMSGDFYRTIASDYDVSLGAVGAIASGRTWSHVEVDGWSDYLSKRKTRKK